MTTRYEVEGPREKWTIFMTTKRQSALSKEGVRWFVSASENGLPTDPTGTTVRAAFLTNSRTEPEEADWKACTWQTNLIGTYVAQCLVGPGGTVALVQGRYYCWLRITDGVGEDVIRDTGMLWID